ncbi:Toluene-4-monooxygenase system, ferredoxin--NAD(+) reductase component [wastewater metagenome]|uniref:Toluene-4-monooxygenase system, ferredoxin--NAD(+) reductase component n=2 Tax=unclassified sequences TaxID=12908 RepID=A0A5B8RGQ9_9ZZZZ|nr:MULTISPECIES: 2Fe-2S iron-sulfur cluster-binding protein [Arhodomonas]MCS4502465.1 2Fe-2S iron-sulfur cluster-binding protein [Arhodomonas aquaeolei]QEA07223.1 toluene-4-monooxygenase system, ferredoxin--NAD(+) reductase component [uncultured organism]
MSDEAPCPVFDVRIADTGEVYQCPARETLLKAMARLGRKGIPSGCHGGGCGVCKVRVTGEVTTMAMSRSHVSEAEERQGYVLACRCYPRGHLSVEVVGKLHKAVTRPRYGFV